MGKQNMYDHTIRVPFFIAGPGLAKGCRTAAFANLRDIYPTVCELAGIAIPETVEAKSLTPILRDQHKIIHKAGYGYFRDVQRMFQTEQWKLVFYPKINRYQLFDLKADPYEQKNLIKVKGYQARVAVMRQSLIQWFNDRGDAFSRSIE